AEAPENLVGQRVARAVSLLRASGSAWRSPRCKSRQNWCIGPGSTALNSICGDLPNVPELFNRGFWGISLDTFLVPSTIYRLDLSLRPDTNYKLSGYGLNSGR